MLYIRCQKIRLGASRRAGSGSRASHRASQASLDRFRLPSLARCRLCPGPQHRTGEGPESVEGVSCLAFHVSRRTHAKGSRLVGAHELAVGSAVARLRCGVTVRAVGKSPTILNRHKDIHYEYSLRLRSRRPGVQPRVRTHAHVDELRNRTPAVFAGNASSRTQRNLQIHQYLEVLEALLDAGFQPSAAQQTRSRAGSDPTYARHMIRLRQIGTA